MLEHVIIQMTLTYVVMVPPRQVSAVHRKKRLFGVVSKGKIGGLSSNLTP
jgi:hypothetical protein